MYGELPSGYLQVDAFEGEGRYFDVSGTPLQCDGKPYFDISGTPVYDGKPYYEKGSPMVNGEPIQFDSDGVVVMNTDGTYATLSHGVSKSSTNYAVAGPAQPKNEYSEAKGFIRSGSTGSEYSKLGGYKKDESEYREYTAASKSNYESYPSAKGASFMSGGMSGGSGGFGGSKNTSESNPYSELPDDGSGFTVTSPVIPGTRRPSSIKSNPSLNTYHELDQNEAPSYGKPYYIYYKYKYIDI